MQNKKVVYMQPRSGKHGSAREDDSELEFPGRYKQNEKNTVKTQNRTKKTSHRYKQRAKRERKKMVKLSSSKDRMEKKKERKHAPEYPAPKILQNVAPLARLCHGSPVFDDDEKNFWQ